MSDLYIEVELPHTGKWTISKADGKLHVTTITGLKLVWTGDVEPFGKAGAEPFGKASAELLCSYVRSSITSTCSIPKRYMFIVHTNFGIPGHQVDLAGLTDRLVWLVRYMVCLERPEPSDADLDSLGVMELIDLIKKTKIKPQMSEADHALVKRATEVFRLKTAEQRAKAECRPAECNITIA